MLQWTLDRDNGSGKAKDVHLDFDSENTLLQHDVANGKVNKVDGGLTGVDHESVGELHGLCTGSAELAGYDDLTAFGAGLHDEAEDTVACTAIG